MGERETLREREKISKTVGKNLERERERRKEGKNLLFKEEKKTRETFYYGSIRMKKEREREKSLLDTNIHIHNSLVLKKDDPRNHFQEVVSSQTLEHFLKT